LCLTGGGKGKGTDVGRDHTSLGAKIWLTRHPAPLVDRSSHLPFHAATVVYAQSRPRIAYVEEWRVLDLWLSQFRNSFLLSLAETLVRNAPTPPSTARRPASLNMR